MSVENVQSRFYAYLIRCKRRGWWYVGKGSYDRIWESYEDYDGVDYTFLIYGVTEPEAFGVEIAVIAAMKLLGYNLYNRASGGQGCSGYIYTEEQKLRIRSRMEETHVREKIVAAHVGKPKSLEHRAKLAANKLGTKASEETRQKLSESHVIAMNRPEVREKQAAAQRGKKHTDEHKAKISEAVKATKAQMDCSYGPRTEEEKQNLSQKASGWWASPAGQAERERRRLKRLENSRG